MLIHFTFKEKSARGHGRTKFKVYCLLNDPWVILSTSKAFYYFCSRGDGIIPVFDTSKF